MSAPDCENCVCVRRLKAENEKLRRELGEAGRAGKRQAAHFSKGKPKPHPKRSGFDPEAD